MENEISEARFPTATSCDNKPTAIPTRFQFISETNDSNLICRSTLVALIWQITRSYVDIRYHFHSKTSCNDFKSHYTLYHVLHVKSLMELIYVNVFIWRYSIYFDCFNRFDESTFMVVVYDTYIWNKNLTSIIVVDQFKNLNRLWLGTFKEINENLCTSWSFLLNK